MSRSLADIARRRSEMFPDLSAVRQDQRRPTKDEQRVFDHFALPKEVREIAVFSSRRHAKKARRIYRMIVNSL